MYVCLWCKDETYEKLQSRLATSPVYERAHQHQYENVRELYHGDP